VEGQNLIKKMAIITSALWHHRDATASAAAARWKQVHKGGEEVPSIHRLNGLKLKAILHL